MKSDISTGARRKIGDIFTDLGKYVLTAVPIAFFVSSAHEISWIVLVIISISGLLLCISGIYIINTADQLDANVTKRKGKQRRVKIQKNSVFVIEEL